MAEEKKFRKAKDSDFPEELEVKVYNDHCGDVFGDLGLDNERMSEIGDIVQASVLGSPSYTKALNAISLKVKNANELAAACIIVGRGIGLTQAEREQNEKKEKK